MRRLPLLDALMIAALVPVWVSALSLHLWQQRHGNLALVGFYVSGAANAADYPRIRAFWPGQEPAAFAVGDVIRTVGTADLAGASPYRFFALVHEEIGNGNAGAPPLVTYEHDGRRMQAQLPLVSSPTTWHVLPLSIGFAVTGTLVLLSRPGVAVARAYFLAALAFAIHWTWFFGGPGAITYTWYAVYSVVSALMFPLILVTASMFPDESLRIRWGWLFAIASPVFLTGLIGAPLPPALGFPGMYVVNIALIAALIGILVRNYRRASVVGRRQLRWAIYGICAGTIPVLTADLLTLVVPDWWWLHDVAVVTNIFIPVGLLVALGRFNLYDIDRLLTSTMLYTLVWALLLWGVLVVVPVIAGASGAALGLPPLVGTIAFSGLMAFAIVMLARWLGPVVERVLFKERYALQAGVNRLMGEIRGIGDPRTLLGLVGHRLFELFGSVNCAVYEPTEGSWVPSLSIGDFRGRETAPDLARHGVLVPSIEETTATLDMETWRESHPLTALPIDDRLVLEHLAPHVVMPIRYDGALAAAITLGAKSSGDVYSSGELALVTAVGETVGNELARLERVRRTAAGPLLVPPRYTVLGEIGRGGMGVVYRVRHVALETDFALKILRPELVQQADLVQRFLREARIMSRLRHPNVVRVFDVDAENGMYSLVMEHVKGRSLKALLETSGRLPLDRAVELACQVGAALTHAHTAEPAVIHRDVKPANILVEDATGRAVVTDFGIAKLVDVEESTATRTGSRLGTPQYCAPEQLIGQDTLDARSDVYAFGMVVYEMVTGVALLRGLDAELISRRVVGETDEHQIALDTALPSALATIIGKAVRKNRDDRYATIAAMLVDLRALVPASATAGASAPPATTAGDTAALENQDGERITRHDTDSQV